MHRKALFFDQPVECNPPAPALGAGFLWLMLQVINSLQMMWSEPQYVRARACAWSAGAMHWAETNAPSTE